jgi:hypothetical protein
MRASRADRDLVVNVLKSAFVQERLAKEELDDRIGQALAARTWGDLDALTADLPAGPGLAPPAQAPVAARVPGPPTRSLSHGEPVSRSARIWASGMPAFIVVCGIGGGLLGGPGPGAVIAGLAAGLVFVVLWVVGCYPMLRERPGPGTSS